jgi:hypothetical protein
MDNDELSAQFCEGLFATPEEKLIVRRLLNDMDEHLIVEEILLADAKEQEA